MLFAVGCNELINFLKTADDECSHDYTIEYFWQGYSQCKGVATCKKCGKRVEKNATVVRGEDPCQEHSCTEDEKYIWTATFSNEIFEETSKIETTRSASHSFVEDEVVWSRDLEDKDYCRIPKRCSVCGHEESEITYNITKNTTPATCTKDGKIEYFATFANGRKETKITEILASHDYSLQYFWVEENEKIVACSAYKICTRCSIESENHKIFVEGISVDNMQKIYVEDEENCYYYIANFTTYGLTPQTSQKIYESSSITDNNEQPKGENEIKEILSFSAKKNENNYYDIYFQGSLILQNTTAIIEGNVFKLIGCEISFEDGDVFYFIDEESFVQFDIFSQDENNLALNYIHYEPMYICDNYKITNGKVEYDSFVEFYPDRTACLFVNILDDIYFPFLPFNNWKIDLNNTIQIVYLEEILQFEIAV